MAYTYTRQSTISDGDTITAALFNNEYNQLLNAFAYSSSDAAATGHRHDGSSAQGGNISKIGDLDFLNKIEADSTNNRWGIYVEVSSSAVEQIRVQDGAIVPVTDNDIDLGTSSLEFKDAYFDGTVTTDALVADTADINGGTVDGATIGASSATTIVGTTITANTAFVPDASDGASLGTTSLEFSDLYLADGAIIYFGDDQDINITHVADTGLTTNGTFQATTITATTAFVPDASDGAALGTSSLEFSDLFLADGAVINLGDDQDTTLTHVADTGILLNSTRQFQFGDSGTYIYQSADGVLDLVSDTEIELNATTIDINGAVDVSGEIAAASLDISGNVDIDGTTNLDAVDIDGAVQIDATVTVGVDDTGYDVKFFGDAASAYMLWDASVDDLILGGAARVVVPDGQLVLGSTAVSSTAAELNILDGVTSTATELNILDGKSFVDEDDMSSDSATAIASQQSIKAYVDSQAGDMQFVLEDGDGTEVQITKDKEVKFVEGGGIDINWTDTDNGTDGDPYDLTFTINAAQTDITSLLATDIKIGEDDQTKIDFEDADKINFYAGNEKQLILEDGALYPGADNIIDLGKSDNEFKDAFFDGTVTADAFAGPLTGDVTGNADTATVATSITASANNSTDETVYPTFVDGATGTQGIETDTGLTYNPSSGDLTIGGELIAATLDISGNVDIDGTLEADAITVNGTTLAETISDTIGAMVGSNTETGIAVTYDDSDNTLDFVLASAQTAITSLLATDIKIGEDDQTKVDFETANEIHLYADNVNKVTVDANGMTLNAGALQLKNGSTSAGKIEFFEDSDNGTNKVTLIGPASTADITLTLPSSDGDAGQFMQTDGSGNLSFADSTGMSTSKAFFMGQL